MNYTQTLREFIVSNNGRIFDVMYEQNKRFSFIPYKTLRKISNRLEKEKLLNKVSKGVYLMDNDKSKLDDSIIDYYVNNFNGIIVGRQMYNYYDIGTNDDDNIEIYTRKVITNNKVIGNYKLMKFDVRFYDEVEAVIRTLELIENRRKIEDFNLVRYTEEIEGGLTRYTDLIFKEIVSNHHYKYSTIATLDVLLDKMSIKNNAVQIYQENYKNAL